MEMDFETSRIGTPTFIHSHYPFRLGNKGRRLLKSTPRHLKLVVILIPIPYDN